MFKLKIFDQHPYKGLYIFINIFLVCNFQANSWKPFPYLLMCVMLAADVLLFQFNVTETKGKPLVDNLPQKKNKKNNYYKNNNDSSIDC